MAIKTLKNRTDIIMINADKGGAVPILDLNDYINNANKQLNDPSRYKELIYDPTLTHANTINDTIEAFKIKQKIPTSIADGLKSIYSKTPQLRLPPKIHKPEHPGSHSSKISEYVDYHLQPEVLKTKSYIKDTNDFLNHLMFGRGVEVPTIVIFLGAIGGMLAMGIIGLFVGAVVLALGYEILMAWLSDEEPAAAGAAGE